MGAVGHSLGAAVALALFDSVFEVAGLDGRRLFVFLFVFYQHVCKHGVV